jgi:effector-binding domain-containing protein
MKDDHLITSKFDEEEHLLQALQEAYINSNYNEFKTLLPQVISLKTLNSIIAINAACIYSADKKDESIFLKL